MVHPFSANVSGVEPSPGFHVASLCRMVGRAENTFLFSLVFSMGAVLVPGLEAGEEDAMFDATLAAMCGLAPWCRALVWLAPNGFQVFFVPRLAGNAGVEPSGVQVASLCRVVGRAENTFMVSLSFLNGALVPGLEACEDFHACWISSRCDLLEILDFWLERHAIKMVSVKGKEKVAKDTR